MIPTGINELAIAICLAALLGFIAKFFRQPLVVAYLAAGALISVFGLLNPISRSTFETFADLGIMLLLFLVGLELNYNSIRLVGRASLIIGLGQIFFASILGFAISYLLGFSHLASAYIAVALTFSSTIIIVKLLSDKKDTNSLYGKISIGVLLVQDAVAILILVGLSGVEAGNFSIASLVVTLGKAIALFIASLWLGRSIIPKIFDKLANSQELLFLTSLAWVFIVAIAIGKLGFSIEIAGFLAGLALANSNESYQIANKLRPLRDFFILLFFVILGSSFLFGDFVGLAKPILILSLFVLIGNPLIILILMGMMGHKKRTSFMAGVTVAQISEFSLILAASGLRIGHITQDAVTVITGVGIVTIIASTYLIIHADRIYHAISWMLSIFERKKVIDMAMPQDEFQKKIVLIGFHRTGKSIAHHLPDEDLLVVDFDPQVARDLNSQEFAYIFGDIADPEVYNKAISNKTDVVISTSPDIEDNLILISKLKQRRKRPHMIIRAETEADAKTLYKKGADYVIVPNLSSGYHLGQALISGEFTKILAGLKKQDQMFMKK